MGHFSDSERVRASSVVNTGDPWGNNKTRSVQGVGGARKWSRLGDLDLVGWQEWQVVISERSPRSLDQMAARGEMDGFPAKDC